MEQLLAMGKAFALAVLCAAVLGCLASTHFILAELAALGVSVPLVDTLAVSGHDLIGLGPVLVILYAGALCPGFLVAAYVQRRVPGPRTLWFSLSAALAVFALLAGARVILGGMPIAGARTTAGLLAQALAGAVAGWLYAYLTRRRAIG